MSSILFLLFLVAFFGFSFVILPWQMAVFVWLGFGVFVTTLAAFD